MRNVLVVDDSEAVRHQLTTHLTALIPGVSITQAATAREGIERFMDGSFDLTFLDGVFSDGTPTNDVLRSMLSADASARIALVSSLPRDHPQIAEVLGNGAYAYLQKPVQRLAIEEIVMRVDADDGRVGRIK